MKCEQEALGMNAKDVCHVLGNSGSLVTLTEKEIDRQIDRGQWESENKGKVKFQWFRGGDQALIDYFSEVKN